MAKLSVPYTGPIVTRSAATADGYSRYFTGSPCANGHLSQRSTATTACLCCKSLGAKSRRLADSDAKEKDRVRRIEKAADIKVFKKRYNSANRALIAVTVKKWRLSNSARVKKNVRDWAQRNPEKCRAKVHKRRTARLAGSGNYTKAEIKALGHRQLHRCAGCRVSISRYYEVDHVIALARGGTNDIGNIQLLCRSCNRSKGAKHPVVWAQENGRLL